ncbi:MAG: DUF1232 domain-containing protein [Thermodesulfovibrionales bacterium]|nr:DUF1232 domain-containing protein [Thermodesulfovibrionales bacterium]
MIRKKVESELNRRTSSVTEEDVRQTVGRAGDFDTFIDRAPALLVDFAARARLFFEMLLDYASGAYTDLPWRTVATLTATVMYLLTPIDIIPDFIFFFGLLDDAALLYAAMRLIKVDLIEYCKFKGYDTDYFF